MNRKSDAKNGVRSIASALGIQRHEIGAYTKMKTEVPLFPKLPKPVFAQNTEAVELVEYRCRIQSELTLFLDNLETSTTASTSDAIGQRYSEGALQPEKHAFIVNTNELPKGLLPPANKAKRAAATSDEVLAKKQKAVQKLLSALENQEKKEGDADDDDLVVEDADDEEDQPILAESEEELFEEDNDYIQQYFDNGEGYHENPSDDNLDEGDY